MTCNGKPTCGCRPCGRRRDIITLLRSIRITGETLQRGDGGGKIKFESRALSMPAAYGAGSYDELLAALEQLRRMGPRHYWNVAARYLRSEHSTAMVAKAKGVVYTTEPHYDDRTATLAYFTLAAPLPRNAEVVGMPVRDPVAMRTPVRRPKHMDKPPLLVRAVIERWDAGVEARPLATGLDALSFLMPASIRLPREVRAAA